MKRLVGKKAVVTGGACGIGLEVVKKFVAEGAEVIFADIQQEAGEKVAAETGATFVRCDVSSSEDVRKVIAAAGDMSAF